jgi:hypothetical protein
VAAAGDGLAAAVLGLAVLMALSMFVIAWRVPDWTDRDATGARGGSYAAGLAPSLFPADGADRLLQLRRHDRRPVAVGRPWLVRVAGYDAAGRRPAACSPSTSCMLAPSGAGAWSIPWLQRNGFHTDRLIAWGLPLQLRGAGALVIAGPAAGAGTLALFCVSSTFVSLAQPAVGMVFPASLAGRALSAYNLVIFLGVFVVQWGIGLLVDAFQAAGRDEVSSFRAAFAVFLALSMLSYGWFLYSRSHNRPQAP